MYTACIATHIVKQYTHCDQDMDLKLMSIHPAFSFKIHNKLVNKASQLNGNSPQQHVTFIEVNEL